MAGFKLPKVKTPAQMKMEMAVGRARTVLPKEERDINLGNMLKESAVKDRLYHGTSSDFSEFKYDPQSLGIWMAKNPEFASIYSHYKVSNGNNPNVMPLYSSLKNPATTAQFYKAKELAESEPNISKELINQRSREILQEQGFDGVDMGDAYVAFDPSKVKSAIGNEGTYDTSNPDITKAHGGIVKMAGGGLKPIKVPKVSVPKIESPTVMKRSDVSDLFRQVGAREGTYGAKRVERAADEIPNLEKMYTREALLDAFSGDNARALMTMNPADFEKYAAPLDPFFLTSKAYSPSEGVGKMGHDEYIKYLAEAQGKGGFSDVPYLIINKEEQGLPITPFISGHEGRHRNRAMTQSGVTSGLVKLLPRAELREPFPRRFQQDYIEALRKEMEMTGNKVIPQTWTQSNPNSFDDTVIRRPAIDLPDLYANGGAVKMRDGGDPEQEFIDQMKEGFSVYNKPTYGNEIPGTPTIDQQRYELTMKGQQEAENRARTTRDNLTAMDPSGTLGIVDALKTVGKSIVSPFAYYGGNAFDWLQTGKVDPVKSQARKESIEEWITPKTQEGGEFLEEVSKIGPAITGSEMGFGVHPFMWSSGIGLTTPKQTAAGLRLGSERVKPFAKDVGAMATELYESGRLPYMPSPNMFAVSPDGKPAKVLAPANEIGFYSPTEAAALNLQRKSGAGQAFLNDIMKGENVRSDEISAMGLDTFLKDKKNVTADEVRDYIAQNKIQLGETRYGKLNDQQMMAEWNKIAMKDYGKPYNELDHNEAVSVERYADQDTSKFSDYSLPGGENYREIVLTLPDKRTQAPEQAVRPKVIDSGVDENGRGQFDVVVDGKPVERFNTWSEAQDHALELQQAENIKRNLEWQKTQPTTYKSSHWDETNPLAHLRVSDRVTDGKKTLLVDEVQSDWHQEGREKGYKTESTVAQTAHRNYVDDIKNRFANSLREEHARTIADPDTVNNLVKSTMEDLSVRDMAKHLGEGDKLNDSLREYSLEIGQNRKGVPDAPYKDDWYQLTLRRAIKEAIDGGYDRVALPTGSRVAERFDLSKQIDRIDYNKNDDGTYSMSAIKGGKQVFSKEGLDENELSGIVGKDVAKKMVGDEGAAQYDADIADELGVGVVKSLTGLDLQVGGKGMKKYYDEIYPNYLKKFGKKYGSTIGKTTVDVDGKPEPLHFMEITPAMRKEFSTGIPMKRGGKVSFAHDIDAMRLELSKG